MSAILVAEGLSKSYAGVRALRDVSLQLAPGMILGLIGPNGSGKTTLVNCISGVVRPAGGRVFVNDVESTKLAPYRIARLGVGRTFQTVRLFRNLTVRENVEVGLVSGRGRAPGWRGRANGAGRILDEVGLSAFGDRLATTLPYGLQRRVEIARAVAADPEYLLLDEPAAGMNEQESDELLRLLGEIRTTRGCALLVIDHDLRLIMRLCDRIHVLHQGSTLIEDEPARVRSDPRVVEAYLGTERPASRAEGSGRPTATPSERQPT